MTPFLDRLQTVKPFLWRHRLAIIFGSLYVFLSFFALLDFLHNSFLGDRFHSATFGAMVNGTAWKPFVHRVLMPLLINTIVGLTPDDWRIGLNMAIPAFFDSHWLHHTMPWLQRIFQMPDAYARVVATIFIYFFVCGYIGAMYQLAKVLFPQEPALKFFAPIFGVLIIPSFSWQWQYLYDIPVLFLSTACYYCLAVKRIRLYLVFFLLACLNKESSIFILLFSALWLFDKLPRRHYGLLLLAQSLIWAAIKLTLISVYAHNPGPLLEHNFPLVLARDVLSLSQFHRILTITLIFVLLTTDWRDKPVFLKYGVLLLPLMYVAYVMFGVSGEYRVFFDIMPLMVLLGTHSVLVIAGITRAPFFESRKEIA